MKRQESIFKYVRLTIQSAIIESIDLFRYWNYVLYGELKGFVMDAFTLQVAGVIHDFEWDADEVSLPYGNTSVREKRKAPPVDGPDPLTRKKTTYREPVTSVKEKAAPKRKAQNVILRPLKLFLRFLFITIPEMFSSSERRSPRVDTENRIRS